MDCEKFDQVLMDALYDELDELTLAAARRHADGCQRCQAAWSGLKATRKVGVLPLVEAPAGLDERVLAAARNAQHDVAWSKRLGRAVSWAGNYAMRPQAAMAAILLLMLGSSVIFVRAKPDRSKAMAEVHVTERGEPESVAAAPAGGRASHAPSVDERAPAPMGSALALGPREAAESESKVKGADKPEAIAEAPLPSKRANEFSASPPAAPMPPPAALERAEPMAAGGTAELSTGAGPTTHRARVAQVQAQRDAYASALDLYGAGRYAEAEKSFKEVAGGNSKNAPQAALFAAKSAEAAFGCGKAAPMYEAAASRYGATTPGAESLWGAANCYKAIGSLDKATIFYNELRKVAGYRDRAEAELASMRASQQNRIAARKAAAADQAAAAAPPPAAAPAAPAAEAPATTPAAPARAQPSRPTP